MRVYVLFACLLALACSQSIAEAVIHNTCQQIDNEQPLGPGFAVSFDRNLDFQLLRGRIIAYKIQWFNDSWSDWFVPEYNDVDWKVTPVRPTPTQPLPTTIRRVWSYFEDHVHTYIICT